MLHQDFGSDQPGTTMGLLLSVRAQVNVYLAPLGIAAMDYNQSAAELLIIAIWLPDCSLLQCGNQLGRMSS